VKTKCLTKELHFVKTGLWGNSIPLKYVFETATDVLSISVYKKNIFGKWKKVVDGWAFHGTARQLSNFLKDWLE